MNRRSWITMATLACAGFAWVWMLPVFESHRATAADDKKPAAKEVSGKDVFGLNKVWDIDIALSEKEYQAMQPKGGMRFPGMPGGPGAPAKPEKPADKPADKPDEAAREIHRSNFGMEFPVAHAQFATTGETFKDIGLRYKGNASYMASARGLKRNFKVHFDQFDDTGRFHGLKSLNLNAGAMDATKAREAMSFAVFRAAGVPAPRTAYAQVTLTVPGKYDKEYLGLYTVIEQVDKTFLKDHFKSNKGVLMKPERLRGIEYLGEDWDKYKDRYQPKHDPTKEEIKRVIEFTKLINRSDDAAFQKEIGSYLDIDEFLRFLAVEGLLVNQDSILSMGHNFYIYLNPENNKFAFIPWDMDLSFANFPMMAGSMDQQLDLSITHPHTGGNKLIDRLLAMKDVNEKYQKILKELATTCFSKEQLLKDIDTIEKTTKDIMAKEAKAATARKEGQGGFGFGPGGMMGRSPDLRTFVEKRTKSVMAQVEGKSKGYVATMGFGPPGGPGGGPGRGMRFGPGNFMAKPLLEALDTDKDGKVSKDEFMAGANKLFKDCDKDKKGAIDEKALAEGVGRIFPGPPGFGPDGPPPGGPGPQPPGGGPGRQPPSGPGGQPPVPPPGGPGGQPPGVMPFGPPPGTMLASSLIKRVTPDKDGKVTLEKFLAAAEALFKECDKDKNSSLDEKEITDGINMLFPAPPGFGPGGGPPGAPPGGFPGGPPGAPPSPPGNPPQPNPPNPPSREGKP